MTSPNVRRTVDPTPGQARQALVPRENDPRLIPVWPLGRHLFDQKRLDFLGFSKIGETGFEPATARPPAGAIWFCRAPFGALERRPCSRVGLGCAHFAPRIAP